MGIGLNKVVALAMSVFAVSVYAENALEYVERRTAEALKIDQAQVGEWVKDRGLIAVVGIAAMENKPAEEILGKRHELAEVAIMDAKLKLAEKLGISLSAEEKRHLWGVSDSKRDVAGITTTSKIQFLAKHRILGATVLLQCESYLAGEYLMAVSLVWSKGLQKSAETIMSGSGEAAAATPGKYPLDEWLRKNVDPALVAGPRQYVDDKGKRHFIGIVSLPCKKQMTPRERLTLERVLELKGRAAVAWSLVSDVETSSSSLTMLRQTSEDGKEDSEIVNELNQRIRQRFRGALPPVKPLFEALYGETCVFREHPLFPGSQMAIYACEYDGEFHEYKYK